MAKAMRLQETDRVRLCSVSISSYCVQDFGEALISLQGDRG